MPTREFETIYDTIEYLQKKIEEAEEMLETNTDEEERADLVESISVAQDGIEKLDRKIDGWRPKD